MAPNTTKKPEKKQKRPTAQKREMQNCKRRLINKCFKSEARTTLRAFEVAIQAGNKEVISSSLSEVYSVLDKGVKRGVFTINKASRTKSRALAKLSA